MDVASFAIDHDKLLPGLYVSRKDYINDGCVTTFDIRLKRPNIEPPLDVPAIHSMEHLLAVYLRGPLSGIADDVVYIGPMGCRTGMYLLMKGELVSEDVLEVVKNAFKYIIDFSEEEVPATTSAQCGNYREHNLFLAKWEAKKYYEEVLRNIKKENMVYP
ncbi:MAG: S-ribosylhomocysteine lyase [Defluviitaleaceae bacterium]|nr:S-ribosylhomocysteine lyase [Defluviitaleaceae bacterium]